MRNLNRSIFFEISDVWIAYSEHMSGFHISKIEYHQDTRFVISGYYIYL